MPTRALPESQGRETRMLLLIVVVAIALLLLLARLRYPTATLPVTAPVQPPLVGSTGPTGVDVLTREFGALFAAVQPRVLVVTLEEKRGRDRASTPAATSGLAVRVGADLAVVALPAGTTVRGDADLGIEPLVVDEPRRIALVRVPPNLATFPDGRTEPFSGMAYVGSVTATRGGPTLQPVYVGLVTPFADDQWAAGLFDLGTLPGVTAGAALFAMDGTFLGLVTTTATPALVSAQALTDRFAAVRPAPPSLP